MIFKQLNRLQQMDQLIRQKRTGNATEFAQKMGVSRRQIYNWLEDLRSMGLDIEYNRYKKSFTYRKLYKINIQFEIRELSKYELSEIEGNGLFLNKISFV